MDLGMDQFRLTPEELDALRRPAANIVMSSWSGCLCGKLLPILEWQRKWHSGRWVGGKCIEPGINYTDLMCEDCRVEFKNWPRIVCIGCRSLMGFYKPGKQATGFEFKKDGHYHILDCPKCNPGVKATAVLEHEQFCKVNKIPTTTNQDLLQEIEQKLLQAEREAAKMRAEFQSSAKQQ